MSERSVGFLLDALAAAHAVTAAEQLGVLERLGSGPADAATLARDCHISRRGATVLLAALAGLGITEASPAGVYCLCAQPFSLAEMRAFWRELEEAVRTGDPRFSGDAPYEAAENYPRIVPLLLRLFAPAAKRFAARMAQPHLRVVDLGAGAAPWSLALAKHQATCRVTAVDLPAVLAVTKKSAIAEGCGSQFRFVEGDLFTVDWCAERVDLVILGNICHLFDEATNARLLRKVFAALQPRGRVAIIDALLDEAGNGPRSAVLYALGLLLRTSTGRAYPFSSYADWMRDAGYQTIECRELSDALPITLVTAQRP